MAQRMSKGGEVKIPTQAMGVSFQYSHTIGRLENSGTGFSRAVAMALGDGDLMYVANRGYDALDYAKRVTICTVGEDYIGQFGRGTSIGETPDPEVDGSIVWPTSLAIDKGGDVYLADEALNRISIFTKDGDWIGKWGTLGDGDGEFNRPSGLAFDQGDNLFLVDGLNNRIQKFTKEGKFLAKWGEAGMGDGEFNMPWGIEIDKSGYVYVADWRNDRIQKFTPEGEFLMKFGSPGSGDGQLNRPSAVAVDTDCLIYVCDWLNDRVQVFDATGSFIAKMTGDATVSKWAAQKLDANAEMWKEREVAQGLDREKLFWCPIAVEVDDEDRVFVLESARSRVQVYRKIRPYFVGVSP